MGFGNRHISRRLSAGLAAALAVIFAAPGFAQSCDPGHIDIRGDWGAARFHVEIADTPPEQARGLMFRPSMPASQGMLFLYPSAGQPAFWMKNTLIALDMLFITPEGRVQHIHPNAVPGDLTPIDGGNGVLAVLEIKGGTARRIGISSGSEVRHPGFDRSIAAWPCPKIE